MVNIAFVLSCLIVAGCTIELVVIRDQASIFRILGLIGVVFWALWRMSTLEPPIDSHDIWLLASIVVAVGGAVYRGALELPSQIRKMKEEASKRENRM
jgi:hypothetical protein